MEIKTYEGSCHCGVVKYETRFALGEGLSCNCSICGRLGALRTFVPSTDFKLLSGADNVTDYQFGKQQVHHVFCKTCGVHAFARGKKPNGEEVFSVNLRCLADVDPDALPVKKFDGKSL